MTLQQQQSIFEPFAMGNMEYSRKHGGTGLGLTISQDILKLMGSHIEVNSSPNTGSTFSFSVWLPISEGVPSETFAQKTHIPLSPIAELLGKKVMVVDDDPLNRMVANDLLKTFGVTVCLVESGKHILAQLANDEPDLIFMDLQMPELDGYETMKLLQEDGRFKHIPVIALTAHASSEDENRCMKAGMIGFITKPVDLNEIKHILISQLTPATQIPDNTSSSNSQKADNRIIRNFQAIVEDSEKQPSEHLIHTMLSCLKSSQIELNDYIDKENWEKSAKCAHRLRGSSNLYATHRLNQLLKTINDNDFLPEELPQIKQDLEKELTQIITEMESLLSLDNETHLSNT